LGTPGAKLRASGGPKHLRIQVLLMALQPRFFASCLQVDTGLGSLPAWLIETKEPEAPLFPLQAHYTGDTASMQNGLPRSELRVRSGGVLKLIDANNLS
jgi:hypothetical protein